jgi:hypothetical protein
LRRAILDDEHGPVAVEFDLVNPLGCVRVR